MVVFALSFLTMLRQSLVISSECKGLNFFSQNCFWSGRVAKNHKLRHQTQEYCLPVSFAIILSTQGLFYSSVLCAD